MTRRSRIKAYGSAAALVTVGALCGAAIGGGLGQILAIALIGLGLVLAISLVFFEVGRSEDRDRELEVAERERKRGADSRKRHHDSERLADRWRHARLRRLRDHRRES